MNQRLNLLLEGLWLSAVTTGIWNSPSGDRCVVQRAPTIGPPFAPAGYVDGLIWIGPVAQSPQLRSSQRPELRANFLGHPRSREERGQRNCACQIKDRGDRGPTYWKVRSTAVIKDR